MSNRSISRARQFGKDLTNMFSFTRQPSRSSTNQNNSGQPSSGNLRHAKGVPSSVNGPGAANMGGSSSVGPRSARHTDGTSKHQFASQASYLPSEAILAQQQQQAQRKSSLNPTNINAATGNLQKSLGSIDFNQMKSQGVKSVTRDATGTQQSIRSRDKLPEIGLGTKRQMHKQRVDKHVLSKISAIDLPTHTDIYQVAEYCQEIEAHMQATERETQPDPAYMKRQTHVNEQARAILVDWLISTHMKFKLLPETLFITVNLVDRYLSINRVERDVVQLVGVAALLIATKYEEIYPPTVKDFIYVTKNTYKRSEILEMERNILFSLEY